MASRKQPPLPFTEKDQKYTQNKPPHTFNIKYAITLISSLTVWFLILFFWFPSNNNRASNFNLNLISPPPSSSPPAPSPCRLNMSVYVYDLPLEFNFGLLDDCRRLSVYTDMCQYVVNSGLGRQISKINVVKNLGSWFATYQFIAEMIFHARVDHHPCRTRDQSRATLFYVPFYGGLDVSSKLREMNLTARDDLSVKLGAWLEKQPSWNRNNGKDHFLALGRTSWDFMRGSTESGGNCLLKLPPVKNMSVLTVERNPWNGSNQFGIPYPSYFHPYTSSDMLTWQDHVRRTTRPHLFSFIGGPRKGLEKAAIRDELIQQCAESTQCELVNCDHGLGTCHNPIDILNVMKKSRFCLQAPGDSFTRRSTFDSVLAGCVPVFFSPHTAYSQYSWFFPVDRSSYSVFIDEKSNASRRIQEELSKISDDDVARMRETVIGLIPSVTYAHPNATEYGGQLFDAVDVALSALATHVQSELTSREKLLRR